MIKELFARFYALPLEDAISIIFIASFLLLFLDNVLENKKLKSVIYSCLFSVSVLAVLFITIINRRELNISSISLLPFNSYIAVANGANPELLRSNFMNVMLFYPLGLFTTLLANKKKTLLLSILSALLFSIIIELIQFKFSLGYVETDDVIHNTLGFILGIAAVKGFNRYFNYIY